MKLKIRRTFGLNYGLNRGHKPLFRFDSGQIEAIH